MHPDILRQLAAEHTRDLITEAGQARRAREGRYTQRRRLAAHLRRSTAGRAAAALSGGAWDGWVRGVATRPRTSGGVGARRSR